MNDSRRKLILACAAGITLAITLWFVWYRPCGRLSGFESYAWGGSARACEQAGCRVIKGREVKPLPQAFDTGGYRIWCIPNM
ncbi:MAG: hypothetical protein WC866_06040 [Patescibacteria group bacterium]